MKVVQAAYDDEDLLKSRIVSQTWIAELRTSVGPAQQPLVRNERNYAFARHRRQIPRRGQRNSSAQTLAYQTYVSVMLSRNASLRKNARTGVHNASVVC